MNNMMKFRVSGAGLNRVEHGIAPPMRSAITIPATVEMGARGVDVVVYVGTSAFGERGVPTSDRELLAIAREIADRLAP